jgi:hypothetical protein
LKGKSTRREQKFVLSEDLGGRPGSVRRSVLSGSSTMPKIGRVPTDPASVPHPRRSPVPSRRAPAEIPPHGRGLGPPACRFLRYNRDMSELTYTPSGRRRKSKPNTVLQRTRCAPLRSPLSLKPLDDPGAIARRQNR